MQESPIILNSKPVTFELPDVGKLTALEVQDKSGKPKCFRYTGVRFAEPPVGKRRWKRPVRLPDNFDYSGNYTKFKSICPQPDYFNHGDAPNPDFSYDEDCLFLNIWIPAGKVPEGGWPVLYFIHGGWLQVGNPHHYSQTDPQDLIAEDSPTRFIVVSPGYRLNLFGFLSSKELLEEDPKSTNFGFWDQRLGLEWVYKHITSFGGNRNNITLGGLSAGSYSAVFQVAYELYHPEAEQIIKRVFMQSNALPVQPKSLEESEDQFNEVLAKFDIPLDISGTEKMYRLREIPFKTLVGKILDLNLHTFRAITDGDFVSSTLFRDIYDGTFGKLVAGSGRSFLIGEVNNEYAVYKATNPPKSPGDLVNQLNNYYPADVVTALLKVYPEAEKNEDPEINLSNVRDLFGTIVSDMQVYVASRLFIHGLIKGGVPLDHINRYRVEFRGKYFDKYEEPEMLVPHAGDLGVWFYNEGLGISDDEKPLYREWLTPYGEWIRTNKTNWGPTSYKQQRIFNTDGTITIEEDRRWNWAQTVGKALAAVMGLE